MLTGVAQVQVTGQPQVGHHPMMTQPQDERPLRPAHHQALPTGGVLMRMPGRY
jgi:hypothetical protein